MQPHSSEKENVHYVNHSALCPVVPQDADREKRTIRAWKFFFFKFVNDSVRVRCEEIAVLSSYCHSSVVLMDNEFCHC